jgi:[Skp1-protein]-hydroxyproline N-acetylglucosaminyltransferase
MNETLDFVLWGIFIFILVIVIGAGISYTEHFLVEGFGITCVDFIPFKGYPKYQIIPDTIFVSVASYRDAECSMTLDTLFNGADFPNRIFVGVCEQNKQGATEELCISPAVMKYVKNIRTMNMDYTKAKGPTYARYYCSDLWRGEEYFLQIDSHTTFIKGWDTALINMIKQIKSDPNESNKPVLSVYPPTKEQMEIKGFPEMDNGALSPDNIPSFYCGWSEPSDVPKRSNKPWAAAGFMFLESKFLYEVPFDPNLSHLFQGEETLFSARLFTNGYDFYAPNKNLAYHHYSRTKAPLYSKDIPASTGCRAQAEKRVLFLLGLIPQKSVADEFLKQHNKYSLGTFRKIDDFWKASGIDFEQKKIEKWNDKNPPSEKYTGWWFRRDGYKNIKKWE